MSLNVPERITFDVSRRAVERARQLAPKKTGRGAASLLPTNGPGQVGVKIPEDVIYMYFQEVGTEPRVMWELAGKTIPIRLPNGQVIFRRATANNIGKPIVSRDEQGRVTGTRLSWTHPGIQAKHFSENALQEEALKWVQQLDGNQIFSMLKETPLGPLIDMMTGDA